MITWEWLAGFVQAEGSFGVYAGTPICSIAQTKEPELLRCIRDFLGYGGVNHQDFRVANFLDSLFFTEQIVPLLWYNKKEQANRLRGICLFEDITKQIPMSWNFVTGFWEGDGGISRVHKVDGSYVTFYQKDISILRELDSYITLNNLAADSILYYKSKAGLNTLSVSDPTSLGTPFRVKLLNSCLTDKRRVQLLRSLTYDGVLVDYD